MMRNKFIFLLFLAVCIAAPLRAASDVRDSLAVTDKVYEDKKVEAVGELEFPDEYLDTVQVRKQGMINDYSMIGIHYGVSLSEVLWNPSYKQELLFQPVNIAVNFTKYCKMFGYLPYFGYQVGLAYGREGYKFKANKDNGYVHTIEGAERAVIDVIDLNFLMHAHIDFWKMKIFVNLGPYAGYRIGIERFSGETGSVDEAIRKKFIDTDIRFDYGIKGGVGFGFVFDPIEIHFTATYKQSLNTLFQPDKYSEYYYRYAYPFNIVISGGVMIHLSKRTGKTKAMLKKMAKEQVYN